MKKLIKHFKKNWYRYGSETLVVIVGVLIAFSLNNWSETRNERKLEHDYLQLILADVQRDKQLLDQATIYLDIKMKNLVFIKDITSEGSEADSLKSRIVASATLGWYASFNDHAEATYEELISSGYLRFVIDPLVRRAIIDYYSNWKHIIERTHQRRSNYPNLIYKLFDDENAPANTLQFRKILKSLDVEMEFLKEINHEINYGRFIRNVSLPELIEKNKSIELIIKEELNED